MDITRQTRLPLWRRPLVRWSALAILALLLAAIGLLSLGPAVPAVARNTLWIDTARQGDMVREIRATGTLVPRDVRWISAGATATVQQRVVEAGAVVSADTVILQLVSPELQSSHEMAQAALAGAEADVAAMRTALASQLLDHQAQHVQAEADWRIAEARARANDRAYAAGIIADLEHGQTRITEEQHRARAEIETQRVDAFRQNMAAQLRAAQARRDEAASALAIVRQQVESLTVRAGIDGILQQVEVEPGQQVTTGTALARVARPDQLIARLQVAEVLAKDLLLELPVAVDTRGGVVEGRIGRIDPAVRNGSVLVDVVFDGALPAGARPDLSVDGRIRLDTLADVVSIGRPSLVVPDTTASLFVIRPGEERAHRRPLRFGAASSDRIEVREGLQPGELAILSDTTQWDGHDTLRLR